MRKTLEELNEQYVPDNASTNFTNSTCRKRLLNRFIGEGKWQYIYEGRRVVAVEIIEDEVVNEIEDEIELCYTSIQEHQSEIDRLTARIKELETLRDSKPVSLKDVFNGINFRRYRWRKYIYDNHTEIQNRYESHKHLQGIEDEYNKVMNRFLIQASKYLASQYKYYDPSSTIHGSAFAAFDRSNWDRWYKRIYDNEVNSCEDYRDRFTVNLHGIDFCINEIDQIVGMFNGFSGEIYDEMVNIGNRFKELRRKATECNAKSDSMFDEFCKGYESYASRKTKREKDEFENFWEQFNYYGGWDKFTGSSSRSTQTKKYFTGCTTKQEIKKRYRTLAKELHPDHGGNQDEFIAMKNEYDRLMKHAA